MVKESTKCSADLHFVGEHRAPGKPPATCMAPFVRADLRIHVGAKDASQTLSTNEVKLKRIECNAS
jgi:hypothetical protein